MAVCLGKSKHWKFLLHFAMSSYFDWRARSGAQWREILLSDQQLPIADRFCITTGISCITYIQIITIRYGLDVCWSYQAGTTSQKLDMNLVLRKTLNNFNIFLRYKLELHFLFCHLKEKLLVFFGTTFWQKINSSKAVNDFD